MKHACTWGKGEAEPGYRRTESVDLLRRSRSDQTGHWSKCGEDQLGQGEAASAHMQLKEQQLGSTPPQLRACLCNKCHVCILAHHLQDLAP